MEKTIINRFVSISLFALLLISPPVVADDISLSCDITFDSIGLQVVNRSPFQFVKPFKRGVASIFLISSEAGDIFTSKNWKLLPATAISDGIVKSLPSRSEKEPQLFALTPADLSEFIPPSTSTTRSTENSRLFVKALVRYPGRKFTSIVSSPIYEFDVKNGRVSGLREPSKDAVPNEVTVAFEREIKTIEAEETSTKFGDW